MAEGGKFGARPGALDRRRTLAHIRAHARTSDSTDRRGAVGADPHRHAGVELRRVGRAVLPVGHARRRLPDTILIMFNGLEHTAIASPNPEALAKWYVEHLEFHINFTYAGNYFVKAKNGTMLEIIPSEGDRPSNKMKDPGIRHLAIMVDDFDKGEAELKKKGVKFLGEPSLVQGNRLVFFSDLDGNILHLIQREKPLP